MTTRLSCIFLASPRCVLGLRRVVIRLLFRFLVLRMMIPCRRVVILLRRRVSTRLLRVVRLRLLCLRNLSRLNTLRRIRVVRRFATSRLIVLGVWTMRVILRCLTRTLSVRVLRPRRTWCILSTRSLRVALDIRLTSLWSKRKVVPGLFPPPRTAGLL